MHQEMFVVVFVAGVFEYFNNHPFIGRYKCVAIARSFVRYAPLGPIKPGFPWLCHNVLARCARDGHHHSRMAISAGADRQFDAVCRMNGMTLDVVSRTGPSKKWCAAQPMARLPLLLLRDRPCFTYSLSQRFQRVVTDSPSMVTMLPISSHWGIASIALNLMINREMKPS
jgi:hypothetical protein